MFFNCSGDYLPKVEGHDMWKCFTQFTEVWDEMDTQMQVCAHHLC